MISIEVVIAQISGLTREDLERWIAHEWVRPERNARAEEANAATPGQTYMFREIDVARVRLIRELRDEMQVNEEALPVVLSLLDQLYDQRRRLRELGDALAATAPEDVRRNLARHLAQRRE
jgi:chaperone modulatory protein CbpM